MLHREKIIYIFILVKKGNNFLFKRNTKVFYKQTEVFVIQHKLLRKFGQLK